MTEWTGAAIAEALGDGWQATPGPAAVDKQRGIMVSGVSVAGACLFTAYFTAEPEMRGRAYQPLEAVGKLMEAAEQRIAELQSLLGRSVDPTVSLPTTDGWVWAYGKLSPDQGEPRCYPARIWPPTSWRGAAVHVAVGYNLAYYQDFVFAPMSDSPPVDKLDALWRQHNG